jgi:chloride channel 3/4/5
MNRTSSSSRSRPKLPSARSSSFTPALRRRNTSASIHSPAPEADDVETEATSTKHAIVEEIAEIKRYEDFTTIDWVQDAAREQLRRKAKRREKNSYLRAGVGLGRRNWRAGKWRRKVVEAYDAGQAWIVVTLVGAAIGMNAAVLNIITEWLSDIKLGHCETAFYLNENFCCWGAESGEYSQIQPILKSMRGEEMIGSEEHG